MRPIASVVVVAALLAGCARASSPRIAESIPRVEGTPRVAFALRWIDVRAGSGAPAEATKCHYAHYTGWLVDGTKFDSSRDTTPQGTPRTPITFPQGARRVIAGWDAGFEGMRVGAQRRLFIPYQLAYGERGRPPRIPPRSMLVFDVELMAIADTLARTDTVPPRTPAAAAPQCPAWSAVAPGS